RWVEADPAARPAPAEAKAQAPVEIRAMDLREGAPEVIVDLEASAPMVWTSFRNAEGRVVVELPNAVPGTGLADLAPEEGLISSLTVQRSEEGSRPLTRLVIATRVEAEHSITADGAKLRIQLLPVQEQQAEAKLAFEPLSEESSASAPAGQAAGGGVSSGTAAGGTPDSPMVAPAPAGATASRLDAIEVLATGGGAVIRIAGDGEFPYSTFVLNDPQRFVIDLDGVINRASRSAVAVTDSVVERVRVAQFRPAPRPVSRVVFDLRQDTVPVIERTSDALVVSFPSAAAAASASPAANRPAPAPAVSRPVASQPSDLALAQRATPSASNAIEAEDAPPLPERQAQASPPPQVQIAPSSRQVQPTAPSGNTQAGNRSNTRPVEVTTPEPTPAATVLQQQKGSGELEKTYFGEPIDLKVTNADVTDVIRTFAQISGLNIIVQPGVGGQVTAELENVPWDQALEQVLKINNLDYELDGNVMRIAPTSVLQKEAQERQQLAAAKALAIPLRTVYQRLSYADARDVALLLRTGQTGILSQRGSVVVDRRTNALIIKELPTNMDAVLSVVDLLDSPEPQVMIEARIVETTKRFTRTLGIAWGFDAIASAATGNTTGLVFPNNVDASGGVNLLNGGQNGLLNLELGNVLNTFNLDVTLQAAESDGLVTILSAPKVATLNNQRASIQSGLQIPVQTILNNTVTVQFINATLRLDVTPQVTAEGTVLMDIDISKREPQLAFLIPGATNAPIATKDARTRLVVRDGGTAVIGGIYEVQTSNGESRVPGLANIPLIGHLFKNKTRSDENDELLIFITPRIIKI
ncbi:MAG TPA: type IV pilus secretin PilQ, partial [Thermoanaerobaculia bacterium]|nr:type IV pilus secretin PilQ [Thermoanaerobaculia bacterium]